MIILNLSLQYAISPCDPTWLLWCVMSAFIQFHMILTRQDQKVSQVYLFQDLSKVYVFKSSTGEESCVSLLLTGIPILT